MTVTMSFVLAFIASYHDINQACKLDFLSPFSYNRRPIINAANGSRARSIFEIAGTLTTRESEKSGFYRSSDCFSLFDSSPMPKTTSISASCLLAPKLGLPFLWHAFNFHFSDKSFLPFSYYTFFRIWCTTNSAGLLHLGVIKKVFVHLAPLICALQLLCT